MEAKKSKAFFIKEGDNNTRFFHRLDNSHRQTNQIRGVEVEGVLYEDDRKVQAQVVEFYKNLIKSLNLGDLPLMDWNLLAWMNLRDYL